MILIQGSGRAADALVSLLRQTQVPEAEVADLKQRAEKAALTRRPELFQMVTLQAGASALRDALTAALAGAK